MAHVHHDVKRIGLAFFLNLGFTVIELIGGWYTNSIAILSDALHDLGDSLSLGAAWYLQRVSHRERDKAYSYGYRRFSMLGAVISSLVLMAGSVLILREAIPRLWQPSASNATGMMLLAVVGVVVNGIAMSRLERKHSHNERVLSLHLLEDVMGWVAVLIGSIVMYFTGWHWIDPVLSIGITLYILVQVWRNFRSMLRILLQGVPEAISLEAVQHALNEISGVRSWHDLHIWSLDGEKNILTVHVVVDEALSNELVSAVKKDVHAAMRKLNIQHTTVEVEHADMDCALENC